MRVATAAIERRLAVLILSGDTFTSDDLTMAGVVTLDASHEPNGRQNGIGSVFSHAARAGHIEFTGRIVRSDAPHRKGGSIRVWQATPYGVQWAQSFIQLTNQPSESE